MTVEIKVGAKLDSADIDKIVQELSDQIGRLGQGVAAANKVKYNPFNRQVFDDADKLETRLKRILALHQQIAKINPGINLGGTPGSSVFPGGGSGVPAPPAPVVPPAVPTPGQAPQPGQPPQNPGRPSPGGNSPGKWWNHRYRNPFSHTFGGRIATAGLNAAGPMGGVAAGALNSAYLGGGGSFLSGGAVSAGLGGLLGGGLALGISKLVGGVSDKIGAAQTENIDYDTLKRQLGDVGVGFNMLKGTLRAASNEIDVTFQEGQKLGTQFARLSGMSAKQSKQLAEEVRIGGSFGRSFGVDPSQSNAFFGRMRQFGVTSNSNDSQKLAVTIGEAIANSGAFSKADEVLEAISTYAAQQTRLGLTAANTTGYSAEFSGLVGAHIPGMDPTGAANVLSRVNGSIANGGNAGEAGQNFLYRAIGTRLGLDPIQTRIMQEQGAFGTGAQTFGKGSNYALFAERYGLKGAGKAAGSHATNMQLVMDQMSSVYAGRPELMLDAMHNMFGTSYNQSMALATTAPGKTGALAGRLSRLGIGINSVNATGISRLGQIESNGSLTEEQKDSQVKAVAAQNQEQTEGTETRRTIVGVSNTMQTYADKAIPILNDMRAGILYMAGDRGKMGPKAIQAALERASSDERKSGINDDFDKRETGAQGAFKKANDAVKKAQTDLKLAQNEFNRNRPKMTDEQQAAAKKHIGELMAARDSVRNNVSSIEDSRQAALKAEQDSSDKTIDGIMHPVGPPTPGTKPGGSVSVDTSEGSTGSGAPGSGKLSEDPWMLQQLADTDRVDGLPSGTAYAQMKQESSFRPKARSHAGAMGLSQVMPETLASLERRWGRKINPDDPKDAVLIQRALMGENMRKFGNEKDALTAYNGGWDKGNWGTTDENRAYAPAIMNSAGIYASKMPTGSNVASTDKQSIEFQHTITLQNPNGTAAAPPVTVTNQVGPPQAAGAK